MQEYDEVLDSPVSPNRWKSFWAAFRYLYGLDQQQVDDFMASYVIYNLDWRDEKQMIDVLGSNYKEKVGDRLRDYYGVVNHLCALGDVEKMYIPPRMNANATVLQNQVLYEKSIVTDLAVRPGGRVLDLGCGRGRVAAHIAQLSQSQVTGLNIDPIQIAQARSFTKTHHIPNTYVVHDFNQLPLPFAGGSFDGIYQIQALSLCHDIEALFRELFRVLKPGARFSLLDWVSLPAYDAKNPEHIELMRRVKPLIGAIGTPTPEILGGVLTTVGFVVLRSENASLNGLQSPLIKTVDIYFRVLRRVVLVLVFFHILPSHFRTLINRLCQDGEAFVKMDNQRLITTSYNIIAEKPLE